MRLPPKGRTTEYHYLITITLSLVARLSGNSLVPDDKSFAGWISGKFEAGPISQLIKR